MGILDTEQGTCQIKPTETSRVRAVVPNSGTSPDPDPAQLGQRRIARRNVGSGAAAPARANENEQGEP
jgi:hypothetical protein